METLEKTDGFRIDMGTWSSYVFSQSGPKHCQACLAGAIMICSLGINPFLVIIDSDVSGVENLDLPLRFSIDLQNKFYLIDDIRSGRLSGVPGRFPGRWPGIIESASNDRMKLSSKMAQLEVEHVPYQISPREFKSWLREVIALLKSENI